MQEGNAEIVLELRKLTAGSPTFRGFLSLEILLSLTKRGGACPLGRLLKDVCATHVAIRQHINDLQAAGYVHLHTDPSSRRCKIIRLTAAGATALAACESRIEEAIVRWTPSEKRRLSAPDRAETAADR